MRCNSLQVSVRGDDSLVAAEVGEEIFAAVADGVGSYSGGGLAANLVCDLFKASLPLDTAGFGGFFESARESLEAASRATSLKMGTTLTAAALSAGRLYFGHVGDCRIYHLRDNGIVTLTSDQTELAYLIRTGVLSRNEAKRYRRKNVLLGLLAPERDFDVELGDVLARSGDRFVVCSDGFYSAIKKVQIRDISISSPDLGAFQRGLSDLLSSVAVSDDASAVLLEV